MSSEMASATVTSPDRKTLEGSELLPTNKPGLPMPDEPMSAALPATSGHPVSARAAMDVDSFHANAPRISNDSPAQAYRAENEESNDGHGSGGDGEDKGETEGDAEIDNDEDDDDEDADADSEADDDSDAAGPEAGPTIPDTAGPKPPPESTALSAAFPLSRVRRVIKEDRDISMCQSDAVVAIALAAQLFVEELAKQGQQAAQASKRKTIAYKDLAKAVSETDRLEFLSDLIPPMLPYKKALEKRKRDEKTMTF
ncbi:hypothetical protein H4R35_004722 [Dimargaris xerosporica]|nr:hypothetical protein H4R35_004722 [Dimargaris xerosporica]